MSIHLGEGAVLGHQFGLGGLEGLINDVVNGARASLRWEAVHPVRPGMSDGVWLEL